MYSVFGERDNKILHIDDIIPSENGLKCNCICPSCGEKLIAKTQGKKNKKCFSHVGNSNCVNGLETAMHKFAKEVIEKEKKIKIPKLIYNKYIQTGDRIEEYTFEEFEIVKEQIIDCDKVELEKYISDFDFKPDILIYIKNICLIVEVAVTHKVDEDKKKKIIKSGISTIEVYLDKDEIFKLNKDELEDRIINATDNKKWIFNRKEKSELKRIDDMFIKKRSNPKPKIVKTVKKKNIVEELQNKYKIDINNLPKILMSSKYEITMLRYYPIRFYWRLIVWDKFINNSFGKMITVSDVFFWFNDSYRPEEDTRTLNLYKHFKNYSEVSNAIMSFFKELSAKKILVLIDSTSRSRSLYKYKIKYKYKSKDL